MQKEQSDDPQVVKYRISYLDPATGLCRLPCDRIPGIQYRGMGDEFHEYVLRNSDTLELVRVADYTMETADEGDFKLLYAEGSYGSRADFRPILTELGAGDSIRMAPENGRSSDRTAFPFFNLESPDKKVVVGIGWTGGWYATLSRSGKAATLNSGMEKMAIPPPRRIDPHAADLYAVLAAKRPDGRQQPLPPSCWRAPHPQNRRQIRRIPAFGGIRLERSGPVQRVRLPDRRVRRRADQPL